jgi:rhamnogalacturonyl hydrolase YesR
MNQIITAAIQNLESFCSKDQFKGWDPYDGLNSTFFQSFPGFLKGRFARLAWIQFFKRSPVNFRNITGVKKDYNPKGLGLFLAGYCNLYLIEKRQQYLDKINLISEKILELQNKEYSGACWGYNFDWQARAFFQPKNTPTVVASVFVANALLDAYELTGKAQFLETARSTCDFILNDLNRTYSKQTNFCFSYSPLDSSVVFNASLLGSRLLARVFSFTNENILIENAEKSVAFCCEYQHNDGSWGYGTLPYHHWIDNFHTGYNLECISDYIKYSNDNRFYKQLDKGFQYYVHTFFTEKGIPKYYNNSIYPIDIHAPAQLIITLVKLNKFHEQKELADKVLHWTITNMQSSKGYFYFQINKFFTSRIPYIRWAQAWMFYALSTYLKALKDASKQN